MFPPNGFDKEHFAVLQQCHTKDGCIDFGEGLIIDILLEQVVDHFGVKSQVGCSYFRTNEFDCGGNFFFPSFCSIQLLSEDATQYARKLDIARVADPS